MGGKIIKTVCLGVPVLALLVGLASQVHAETAVGTISALEERSGSARSWNVSLKSQNGKTVELEFRPSLEEFKLLIDGKTAKQSELKTGTPRHTVLIIFPPISPSRDFVQPLEVYN